MRKLLLYSLLVTLLTQAGCKQEYSCEDCEPLQKCFSKTIRGIYKTATTLDPSNTIDIEVEVKETGAYTITTDTVNGYYFNATGSFSATGRFTVTLQGFGTPVVGGTDHLTISYGAIKCVAAITVTGVASIKDWELVATGDPSAFSCSGAVATGHYLVGRPVNTSNSVLIKVEVFSPGPWSVTTPAVNGVYFEGSGTFTSTGIQNIQLFARGTPSSLSTGSILLPITHNSMTCSFRVDLKNPAVFDFDCANYIVYGHYQAGVALSAYENFFAITGRIVSTGTFIDTTIFVNGMRFHGSHASNLPAGATISVWYRGEGVPTSSGITNVPINNSQCVIPIPVSTRPMDWEFKYGAQALAGPAESSAMLVSVPSVFSFTGTDIAVGDFKFSLIDGDGIFQAGEIYSTDPASLNGASFEFHRFSYPARLLDSLRVDNASSVIFIVESHNPATHTITGKILGQAKAFPGNDAFPISEGKFRATY